MRWIILHTVFFIAPLIQAQEFRLTLERESIKIGEQIQLSLEFDYEANRGEVLMDWPKINDTITSQVEIIRAGETQSKVLDPDVPLMQNRQSFIVTSFDTGYLVIPPFEVLYNDSSFQTEPQLLHVVTVEIDTSKGIADIKPNYDVEYSFADRFNDFLSWFKSNWYIPVGVAVLVAALLFIFYRWRKSKKEPQPEVKLPAHVIALHHLDDLANKKLWTKGQTKEHFVELIQIIRIYIENRYGVRAREKTTQEIINGLRLEAITEEQKRKLRNLLSLADLVKFAKEQPLDEDNENSLKKAYEFVEETKFSEEEKKAIKEELEAFKRENKERNQ